MTSAVDVPGHSGHWIKNGLRLDMGNLDNCNQGGGPGLLRLDLFPLGASFAGTINHAPRLCPPVGPHWCQEGHPCRFPRRRATFAAVIDLTGISQDSVATYAIIHIQSQNLQV